jgi:hypothetical protein
MGYVGQDANLEDVSTNRYDLPETWTVSLPAEHSL